VVEEVALREGLEQVAQLLRSDADARVAHGEGEVDRVLLQQLDPDVQVDLAGARELQRVAEQVGQDLAQPRRIPRAGTTAPPAASSVISSRPFSW
jgi:hypothetical protein